MIQIKILNAKEVVLKRKGRFVSSAAGIVIDLQKTVEREVMRQIRKSLEEQGIKADIGLVPDALSGQGPISRA